MCHYLALATLLVAGTKGDTVHVNQWAVHVSPSHFPLVLHHPHVVIYKTHHIGKRDVATLFTLTISHCNPSSRRSFIVQVEGGVDVAEQVAAEHGFVNLGKVRMMMRTYFPASLIRWWRLSRTHHPMSVATLRRSMLHEVLAYGCCKNGCSSSHRGNTANSAVAVSPSSSPFRLHFYSNGHIATWHHNTSSTRYANGNAVA